MKNDKKLVSISKRQQHGQAIRTEAEKVLALADELDLDDSHDKAVAVLAAGITYAKAAGVHRDHLINTLAALLKDTYDLP